MNKTILLICFLLLSGGCSWTHHFAIYNKTSQKLTIKYKLTSAAEEGVFKKKVLVLPIRGSRKDTITLARYDEANQTVAFELEPSHFAVIGVARNTSYKHYRKYERAASSRYPAGTFFNLGSLEFLSSSGALTCRGDMIETLITKDSDLETRIVISKL